MEAKTLKKKLKRRGNEIYDKYFFNPSHIINEVINKHDNNIEIDYNDCEVIFNTKTTSKEHIYELIRYYPNLLKEKHIITDKIVNDIYNEWGGTIEILRNYAGNYVRSKLTCGARTRSRDSDIAFDIISEDIKLTQFCPLLNVPIEYGNRTVTQHSASLDRIVPSKGYVKGNIQVVTMLGNQMKSSATKDELLTFAKNIIKIYGS